MRKDGKSQRAVETNHPEDTATVTTETKKGCFSQWVFFYNGLRLSSTGEEVGEIITKEDTEK